MGFGRMGARGGFGSFSVLGTVPPAISVSIPTANLVSAFSAIKVNGFSGSGMTVRRSDGSTLDIGWVGNRIDKAAADAFAAASGSADKVTLTLPKAYDQIVATANDMAQATAGNQPLFSSLNEWHGIRPITSDRTTSRWLTGAGTLSLNRNSFTIYLVIAPRTSWYDQTFFDLIDNTPTSIAVCTALKANMSTVGNVAVPMARNARSGIQVIAFSSNGTSCITHVAGTTTTVGSAMTSAAITNLGIGKTVGNKPSGADVFFGAVYSTGHDSTTIQATAAALRASFSITDSFTKRLVASGSSLGMGVGSTNNQTSWYQAGFGTASLPDWELMNVAVSGETQDQAYTGRSKMTAQYSASFSKCMAYIGSATNDFAAAVSYADQATAEAAATTLYNNTTLPFVSALKTAGFGGVVVATTFARVALTTANFTEYARLKHNQLVIAGAAANGYVVSDHAGDSRLQNSADTTYFNADGTHLTNAGYAVVASLDRPAVLSL